MAIAVVRTVPELRARVAAWRGAGLRIGLVATMGALHDGHRALVRAALAGAERVVVSLFVNPTQFGPGEDFAAYPRDEARDRALLGAAGAHLLYAPTIEAMYPPGEATRVVMRGGPSEGLCAAHRPGHFDGVATVVAKLLVQTAPDAAWFGEKDYQQLLVVRRLVADLALPVAIHGVATQREPDGLALSSRNAYLSAAERAVAPALHRTLAATAQRLAAGESAIDEAAARARAELLAAGFAAVDYVEVRDAATLAPVAALTAPARLLAAARLGRTRLIDNVALSPGN